MAWREWRHYCRSIEFESANLLCSSAVCGFPTRADANSDNSGHSDQRCDRDKYDHCSQPSPPARNPRQSRIRPAPVLRRRPVPRNRGRPVHARRTGQPRPRTEERQVAYYNVNTHLNPTNVCVYRCIFCAFRADLKSPKGYVMTDEQILERAAEADAPRRTELHIVGGLHHQLPYEWYLNVVRIIHQHYPRLHLKAYTAVEWDWFERLTGRPTSDIARRVQGGRPRQPARRRGGDLPSRSRATTSASTRPTPTTGCASTARPTSSACAPTRPCSTATSRSPSTASTT